MMQPMQRRRRSQREASWSSARSCGGDFLRAVPEGGDCYVLKSILHNWDDAQAVAILHARRRSIARNGKVLVVNPVLPPADQPSANKAFDLVVLALTGGQARTEAEFRALFAETGFQLQRAIPAGWRAVGC
jgi:O-methyltransferase domain